MANLTFESAPMGASRTLLLGSLSLNVFLVGVGVALFLQPFAPLGPPPSRSLAMRIDQLAATLPVADAQTLRSEFADKLGAIENTRQSYRGALDTARDALQAAPFDGEAARNALGVARAKRFAFDEALSDVVVLAAGKMSPEGREKLAEWRSGARRR